MELEVFFFLDEYTESCLRNAKFFFFTASSCTIETPKQGGGGH